MAMIKIFQVRLTLSAHVLRIRPVAGMITFTDDSIENLVSRITITQNHIARVVDVETLGSGAKLLLRIVDRRGDAKIACGSRLMAFARPDVRLLAEALDHSVQRRLGRLFLGRRAGWGVAGWVGQFCYVACKRSVVKSQRSWWHCLRLVEWMEYAVALWVVVDSAASRVRVGEVAVVRAILVAGLVFVYVAQVVLDVEIRWWHVAGVERLSSEILLKKENKRRRQN